jgi:energy-coupling factor transporter ATP-binding protein EcfA2
MAAIDFRDVRKTYGTNAVVHGITLEIADGEFVVIVGPSGCGKSTLLRMVAGLEVITGGEIAESSSAECLVAQVRLPHARFPAGRGLEVHDRETASVDGVRCADGRVGEHRCRRNTQSTTAQPHHGAELLNDAGEHCPPRSTTLRTLRLAVRTSGIGLTLA